jgi:hypothetical protein
MGISAVIRDAKVFETASSRLARDLTPPMPGPAERATWSVEVMEGREVSGLERSDRLEDSATSAPPRQAETGKVGGQERGQEVDMEIDIVGERGRAREMKVCA